MSEMTDAETENYAIIKSQIEGQLDIIKDRTDKLNTFRTLPPESLYYEKIRIYFKELLSDGFPHKMKEIQSYVFEKLNENNERR